MTAQISLFTQMAENFGQHFSHFPQASSTKDSYRKCCAKAAERLMSHIRRNEYKHDHITLQACITPVREKFYSGVVGFDKHATKNSPLMTGNVSSEIQTSTFIRAKNNLECNGQKFEPGLLRELDSRWVKSRSNGARRYEGGELALDWLRKHQNKEVVLYCVFHPKAKRDNQEEAEKIVHGWVLTDRRGNLLESICLNSVLIVQRAIQVFTNERSVPGSLIPENTSGDLFEVRGGELIYAHQDVLNELSEDDFDRVNEHLIGSRPHELARG